MRGLTLRYGKPWKSCNQPRRGGIAPARRAGGRAIGAEVEDELGRLLPPEALDHFRKVAEREQVIGKAEEMGFDGAFIKQRQDLILMMQMVGGE